MKIAVIFSSEMEIKVTIYSNKLCGTSKNDIYIWDKKFDNNKIFVSLLKANFESIWPPFPN